MVPGTEIRYSTLTPLFQICCHQLTRVRSPYPELHDSDGDSHPLDEEEWLAEIESVEEYSAKEEDLLAIEASQADADHRARIFSPEETEHESSSGGQKAGQIMIGRHGRTSDKKEAEEILNSLTPRIEVKGNSRSIFYALIHILQAAAHRQLRRRRGFSPRRRFPNEI